MESVLADDAPRSRLHGPELRYRPIHVTAKPNASEAICGEWVLIRPVVLEVVELGRVKLDDVELEMGYIGNLKRHPEAAKAGLPCGACLEKVAKLREKANKPKRDEAARQERAQRTKHERETERNAKIAKAKADQEAATLKRKATRQVAWETRMLEAAGE